MSLLLLFVLATSAFAASYSATVISEGSSLKISKGIDKNGVAWATFDDQLLEDGWGKLNVATNSFYDDSIQALGAGIVEGYLTASHISRTYYNLAPEVWGKAGAPSEAVQQFLNDQESYWKSSVVEHATSDPFWAQAGYLYNQYEGLQTGYDIAISDGSSEAGALPSYAFQMLNGVGDLFDIIPAVDKSERVDWDSLKQEEAERLHTKMGHCSALVKVTGNYSDLFVSHSSWFTFSNTDRIFKFYNFAYADKSTASRQVAFSSYPGFLESLDDFYMLGSGLTWVQTSNGVINQTIYENVTPQSMLAWQRVRIASAMAHTGEEWYDVFRTNHSGTYANQYMVVDMNLFKPNQPLVDGLLWVVEEVAGLIVGSDETPALRLGYWASYNVPYFKEIYDWSGYPSLAKKFGNYWTHDLCPRAQIFRRDEDKVVDLESLKLIMRYNNYLNDPYSLDSTTGEPNPDYAICARGDLRKADQSPGGCYDTKLTSYLYGAQQLKAQAINGPTSGKYSGGDLPPFSFTGAFSAYPHEGLPKTYKFDFIEVEPTL